MQKYIYNDKLNMDLASFCNIDKVYKKKDLSHVTFPLSNAKLKQLFTFKKKTFLGLPIRIYTFSHQ